MMEHKEQKGSSSAIQGLARLEFKKIVMLRKATTIELIERIGLYYERLL